MYPQGLDFGGTRHFLRVHTFKCIIIFFNLPPTVVCHFYSVVELSFRKGRVQTDCEGKLYANFYCQGI